MASFIGSLRRARAKLRSRFGGNSATAEVMSGWDAADSNPDRHIQSSLKGPSDPWNQEVTAAESGEIGHNTRYSRNRNGEEIVSHDRAFGRGRGNVAVSEVWLM
jgi:hypothetical protein